MNAVTTWGCAVVVVGLGGFALGKWPQPGSNAVELGERSLVSEQLALGKELGDWAENLNRWAAMGADELEAEYLAASERGEEGFAAVLLERLAEVDIHAALAAEREGLGTQAAVIAVWVRQDPEAAIAEALRRWRDEEGNYFARSVAEELVATDPVRALQIAEQVNIAYDDASSIFARWSHTDLEGATSAAISWCTSKQGVATELLEGIVDELLHSDPKRTLTWMEGLPKGWGEIREHVATRWSRLDPRGAVDLLRGGSVTDKKLAAEMAQQLLYMVPECLSMQEVRALYFDFPGTEMSLGELADTFAPLELINLIESKPESKHLDSDYVGQIVAKWAKQNPRAAAQWAIDSELEFDAQSIIAEVSADWAETDRDGAMAFIAENASRLGDGSEAWEVLEGVVDEDDEEQVLEVFAMLPLFSREQRAEIEAGLVGQWVRLDPEAAAEFALALDHRSEDTVRALAVGWFREVDRENEPSVADWFRDRAIDEIGIVGMGTYMNSWLNSHPADASRWIATQEPGPIRDLSVRRLVNSLEDEDPEAAYRWGATLEEGKERDEILERNWEAWQKFDPEGAAAFAAGRD